MSTQPRSIDTLTDDELSAIDRNPAASERLRDMVGAELARRKKRREETRTEDEMTDEEHVSAIVNAVRLANEAVAVARGDGLTVEISATEIPGRALDVRIERTTLLHVLAPCRA